MRESSEDAQDKTDASSKYQNTSRLLSGIQLRTGDRQIHCVDDKSRVKQQLLILIGDSKKHKSDDRGGGGGGGMRTGRMDAPPSQQRPLSLPADCQ